MELSFRELVNKIRENNVYMLIGNGSQNQFGDMRKVKSILRNIIKDCTDNSVFLYFGDAPNETKPDVGLLFKLIHSYNPNIHIYMIQIIKAKPWGVPEFVSGVYWHKDYTKDCMWGGIKNGNPCSNTKKWVSLHKKLKNGITKIFIFGGGSVTLDEYKIAKTLNISYIYFPVVRKYKGDKKTRVKTTDSKRERVGITFNKIK